MIDINGRSLRLEDVEAVARSGVRVGLDGDARSRVDRARALVDRIVAEHRVVYGITTGFGALAEVVIPPERIRDLQVNLIRSHAAGVGDPFSVEETRAITLLRANVLALGHSGVRPVVIERLLDLLNHSITPVIPSRGSVGASGDLAPLSHLALVLMGEGEAWVDGERVSGADALARRALEPLVLEAKEGLALNNGTQAHTAVGILALLAAERAVDTIDVAGALSLEALRGTPDAFAPQIQQVRPHPGQQHSAERLRSLLADSGIRDSHRENDPRVQDAYSLRCMPQVHGAARNGLAYVRSVLEIEANSATDNPLIFPDDDLVISGGNFHGQPVAQVLDLVAMICADLAAISERRIARMIDPALSSGLPAFLVQDVGVNSGLMMVQIVAAALVNETRLRANPASTDNVPTDNNREDHVSMGVAAALKAREAVHLLESVLALERSVVEPLEQDRVLSGDIAAVERLVRDGAFARV